MFYRFASNIYSTTFFSVICSGSDFFSFLLKILCFRLTRLLSSLFIQISFFFSNRSLNMNIDEKKNCCENISHTRTRSHVHWIEPEKKVYVTNKYRLEWHARKNAFMRDLWLYFSCMRHVYFSLNVFFFHFDMSFSWEYFFNITVVAVVFIFLSLTTNLSFSRPLFLLLSLFVLHPMKVYRLLFNMNEISIEFYFDLQNAFQIKIRTKIECKMMIKQRKKV